MPILCGGAECTRVHHAAATGRMKSIDMPLCSHHLQLIHAALSGRQRIAGGEQPRMGQIRAKLTYYAALTEKAAGGSLSSCLQQSLGSDKNGKRYPLHQPASETRSLSARTLSLQSNH